MYHIHVRVFLAPEKALTTGQTERLLQQWDNHSWASGTAKAGWALTVFSKNYRTLCPEPLLNHLGQNTGTSSVVHTPDTTRRDGGKVRALPEPKPKTPHPIQNPVPTTITHHLSPTPTCTQQEVIRLNACQVASCPTPTKRSVIQVAFPREAPPV